MPKIDVLVSGTFRSDQGAPLAATWNAPVGGRVRRRSAGRRPSSAPPCRSTSSRPGQVWGDRVNALDLRFAKILRFGRTRNTIGIDIYNLMNSDAILTYNQTFNPAAATGRKPGWRPRRC